MFHPAASGGRGVGFYGFLVKLPAAHLYSGVVVTSKPVCLYQVKTWSAFRWSDRSMMEALTSLPHGGVIPHVKLPPLPCFGLLSF